jgi:hypothetical protein
MNCGIWESIFWQAGHLGLGGNHLWCGCELVKIVSFQNTKNDRLRLRGFNQLHELAKKGFRNTPLDREQQRAAADRGGLKRAELVERMQRLALDDPRNSRIWPRSWHRLFDDHEERNIMIVVWHVGSARLAFRRGNGIEGSLGAVECAAPAPEKFAGAAVQRVQRTGRPIFVAFKSGAVCWSSARGLRGNTCRNARDRWASCRER